MAQEVRILVVGDTAVGKTSLLYWLCHGAPIKKAEPTVGCICSVRLHDYRAAGRPYFLEFWDVSGLDQFIHSRKMFFAEPSGVICVYDLTNLQTFANIEQWLTEIINFEPIRSALTVSSKEGSDVSMNGLNRTFTDWVKGLIDSNRSSANAGDQSKTRVGDLVTVLHKMKSICPVLIIGNKSDLPLRGRGRGPRAEREAHLKDRKWIFQETGVQWMESSALDGTGDLQILDNFFDKVVERKHFAHGALTAREGHKYGDETPKGSDGTSTPSGPLSKQSYFTNSGSFRDLFSAAKLFRMNTDSMYPSPVHSPVTSFYSTNKPAV
mmetsp:Transcript_12714/g.20793  ORF Transcript_12714/g.20793 Transcript_12714/m.20793 type:complete len:323 (+) Transcript_12714:191-1159(+)